MLTTLTLTKIVVLIACTSPLIGGQDNVDETKAKAYTNWQLDKDCRVDLKQIITITCDDELIQLPASQCSVSRVTVKK